VDTTAASLRLKCLRHHFVSYAGLFMPTPTTPPTSECSSLPTLAQDFEDELVRPARERVLDALIGPSERERLTGILNAATRTLPQSERLIVQAECWDLAIHQLRSTEMNAQARLRAAVWILVSQGRVNSAKPVAGNARKNTAATSIA
jgi:hypothetical protein